MVDLQKGEYNDEKCRAEPEHAYLWNRIRDVVVPNGQRLIAACRQAGVEVMYTVVESLTLDGRDRSLDYKISGIFAAKGSWEARSSTSCARTPTTSSFPRPRRACSTPPTSNTSCATFASST